MSFDRKLVPEDDESVANFDDADWPDELSAFAEQLSDDAAHLASMYPASSVLTGDKERTLSVKPNKHRRWKQGLAFGGTLASVLILAFMLPHLSDEASSPTDGTSVLPIHSDLTDEASSVQTVSVDTSTSERNKGSNDTTVSNIEFTPSFLLLDATGPELEGLLDLLEHEKTGEDTLSI